ncbi:MAG: hypothetical protein M1474_02395 [Candidatus Marsarchaeota archaeon]|nr:hypothetical protein [Candidatus Marsarchaeota archaeon]
MSRRRGFSLYDVEQFLKEAGAERVNEKAVRSLEKELEDCVNGMLSDASMYARYAGRSSLIKLSDIELAKSSGPKGIYVPQKRRAKRKQQRAVIRARQA